VETVLQVPAPPSDDASLAERFRAGDSRAFEEIVTRHRRSVYLMALRLLGRHEDADEAAQLAFVRAWNSRVQFRGDASVRTWLIRIVLNVAKTMRSGRRPAETAELPEWMADGSEGSEARLRRAELRRRVRRSVSDLPPRQREVVLLKVFSELTYREVAWAMQLSEGAVKAHLHQAVSNLRRWFADRAEEG
jgi:RNA polymerase sigma-70 factor (ECF subfamily)